MFLLNGFFRPAPAAAAVAPQSGNGRPRPRTAPAFLPLAYRPVGLSSNRTTPSRVAINQRTHDRLRQVAVRRFGRRGQASRLGSLVLDEYLRVMERHYFGRAGASAADPIASANIRNFDAVLFDMDGVLCNSELLSREAGVSVLRKLHGIDAEPEEFAAFTGMGEGAFLAGVATLHGVKNFDQEKAKEAFFEEYINGGFVYELKPFPGVRQLVSRVRALGLRVAVASAADRIKVNANLEAIGLRDEFDFVASSELIERKKPAPDVFLAAADGVGVPPERCVVVEDAAAGVQAAKAAGMRCLAVTTSLDAEKLAAAGADLIRLDPAAISVADLLDEDPAAVEEELAELANRDSAQMSNTPSESASGSASASASASGSASGIAGSRTDSSAS